MAISFNSLSNKYYSCIMFGVCFQALLSIEFNFHYWYYLKFELVNSKPGESYKERCCDSRPLSA